MLSHPHSTGHTLTPPHHTLTPPHMPSHPHSSTHAITPSLLATHHHTLTPPHMHVTPSFHTHTHLYHEFLLPILLHTHPFHTQSYDQGLWLVCFSSEYELGKFESALAAMWKEQFQVSKSYLTRAVDNFGTSVLSSRTMDRLACTLWDLVLTGSSVHPAFCILQRVDLLLIFHSLVEVVSSPDPTLPERKRVWLQYDIPPDPVT